MVYSLVSIPLILHWLPKAEFGMWVVLVQLMAYVSIIDLGMTPAVARLLIDHKDERQNGGYGALVKTAFMVSLVQGLLIMTAVILGAPWIAKLMAVPMEYTDIFVNLLRVQGLLTAFSFAMRPLILMLEAHQRMDIMGYLGIANLIGQLGTLVWFLSMGCGIYSFLYSNIITALLTPVYLFWNCRRLDVLPRGREWGRANWEKFREVFAFGMDVFLYNLGGQLIMSSQTIIISRCLGLEAAAAWSVGTKIFTLSLQILVRPLYMSMPVLAEMSVRKEISQLRSRFDGLVVLTGSLGVYLGISFALCNSLFIGLWTNNSIEWSPVYDVMLALWLIVIGTETVHCSFTLVIKQVGGLRYINFLEGACFVIMAGIIGMNLGLPGIISCSVICALLFSFPYGLRRSLVFFQCSLNQAHGRWIKPCLKMTMVYGVFATAVWVSSSPLPVTARFFIHIIAVSTVGIILFFRFGCPTELTLEMVKKLPKSISRILKLVLLQLS